MCRVGAPCMLERTSRPKSRSPIDLARIVVDAPGGQQRFEIGGVVRHRPGQRIRRILAAGVRARVRIDEQHHLAAVHHELVDGVQRLGRELLRMHHHQHVHVLVDVVEHRLPRAHREDLFDRRKDRPGLAHASAHGVELSLHAQRTQQPDHRLFRRAEFVNELGDVVLEKLLAVRLEVRDDGTAVGRVGAGKPEIQCIAAAPVQRLQPVLGGAILVLGEGLRVDHAQPHLAVGAGGDLLEEFAHPRGVRQEQRRLLRRRVAREIEIEVDRLLELARAPPACPALRV